MPDGRNAAHDAMHRPTRSSSARGVAGFGWPELTPELLQSNMIMEVLLKGCFRVALTALPLFSCRDSLLSKSPGSFDPAFFLVAFYRDEIEKRTTNRST